MREENSTGGFWGKCSPLMEKKDTQEEMTCLLCVTLSCPEVTPHSAAVNLQPERELNQHVGEHGLERRRESSKEEMSKPGESFYEFI